MTHQLFNPSRAILMTSGLIRPSWKVSFFLTTTTTPTPVYTTSALSTTHTQPVEADSGGVLPAIYLDPSITYKASYYDQNDVLQYTDDPVNDNLLSQDSIAELLYPRTAGEIAAGVTPTNYAIPSHLAIGTVLPERYGNNTTPETTDMTAAVQNALLVAAQALVPVTIGVSGTTLCTENLVVPVGLSTAVDIQGVSWTTGGLRFEGASVTTGLTFSGSSYSYCGEVRNLRIHCADGAVRGITFDDVNHPRVTNCAIHGADGAGVLYDTTLMGELNHTLIIGCGSATEASVEVDGVGTTWLWNHSRISDGDTTQGGLKIDRTFGVTMLGGAIESSGTPLRIGSKTETSRGCEGGIIHGVDFENPGNGNPYIDCGEGLSSSAGVVSYDIRGCIGTPSGTTTVPYAVRMNASSALRFGCNRWAVPNGTSVHELTSTTNTGIVVEAHRDAFGTATPWARLNGAQVKAAGPHLEWASGGVPRGFVGTSVAVRTGATPSILLFDAQGGYYSQIIMSNGGATTVTALTGGERGMEITIFADDANTTLTHSTSTSDQFNTLAGSNLAMASGKAYRFVHNGTLWVQV